MYGDLTARANACYFAALSGVPVAAADRALADVGLAAESDALVDRMSGGQRTRVSLACALLAEPDLLVLDEPTVGLDPVLRRDLWQLFGRLAADGIALLVSSHVMDEAGRCDRLLLLREGRLVAADTPAAIRDRTGQVDLEQAFLTLIESGGGSPGVAR